MRCGGNDMKKSITIAILLALILAIAGGALAKETIIIGTVVGIQESLINEFIVPAQ